MYERTYHAKVQSRQVSPQQKKKRRIPIKRIVQGILILGAVALIVLVIRLPGLQVRTVSVEGTEVVDPEDVSFFIRSEIEGSYLSILPKRSMLLVPTTSLAKWTARQFPRFETVSVKRKGLTGLTVSVTEHVGTYLWCTDSECFFMNPDGVVFAPAPIFSGDAYPRIFIGSYDPLPFRPLSSEQLAMVTLLLERLPLVGINPTSFRLVSERELVVGFTHHATDATVVFDPQTDIAQALEHLAVALHTDPLQREFQSRKVLQYLDARFANRIVYKFVE